MDNIKESVKTSKSIEQTEIQSSSEVAVEDVNLNKYLLKESVLEFPYESVHRDFYKGNYNRAQMQERLDQFKLAIGENQYDHSTQKMSGRAAIQLIMKKNGDKHKTIESSKILLDLIFSCKKQQKVMDQLKQQLINDIEKSFDSLRV
ncbi:hypothetical protein ABPG72_014381 [Tetrahymena utriculariae]